jgi:hypothetical protein
MTTKTLLLLLAFPTLAFGGEAYLRSDATTIHIGNDRLERVFRVGDHGPRTVALVNKESGRTTVVASEEFGLSIVFAGFGPAEGKAQNGENPALLTAASFRFAGWTTAMDPDGARELVSRYRLERFQSLLIVDVHYRVSPSMPFMRKWITVTDSIGSAHFLDAIDVERLRLEGAVPSHGEFGQPVFAAEFYLGVEYPGAVNHLEGSAVACGYVAGVKLGAAPVTSETAVFGVAPDGARLERSFLAYVETIKVGRTRPYLLYNTWYDLRHPSRVDSASHAMTEANVLQRIEAFRTFMEEPHGITLDAFVLDDGWDNVNSIWRIDTTTFPRGFQPIVSALRRTGTRLGMWASPFCGYDMRQKRVAWGSAHGYERTGDFLCFAGTRYGAEFKKQMTGFTRDDSVGYYKWDGFLLACNETDHGHLPGVYSRTALIRTFIEMMAAARREDPAVFINITVGTWLSPWWLRYADCIWMQGEDYAYAEDVPSLTPRDKAITYRDAVLYGDFQRQHLLFPVSGMMTHGIIKGRLNMLGGREESLASFTNEVMMYFGRGVMMWELYVSPDALTPAEWNAIASCVRWAKDRAKTLQDTRMILGNPLKREPYGYVHSNGRSGILLLRNPSVAPTSVRVPLGREFGFAGGETRWRVMTSYPYREVSTREYRATDAVEISLGSHATVVAEIVPSNEIVEGTPLGVRFTEGAGGITLYGEPGSVRTVRSAGIASPERVRFSGTPPAVTVTDVGSQRKSPVSWEIAASVGLGQAEASGTYAVLVEPAVPLTGGGVPVFRAVVDGASMTPTVEQEGGKWFWVLVPVGTGKHDVAVTMETAVPVQGKAEAWFLTATALGTARVGTRTRGTSGPLLPSPAAPDRRQGSMRIGAYALQ